MQVIDARSGQVMTPGSTVRYPDGEWIRLETVSPGIFRASAVVTSHDRNAMTGAFATRRMTVPLVVRWMHPGFFGRHVAFLPT